MNLRKPLGLVLISALMVVFGAISTFTVFLEIVYSIRTQGFSAVMIVSPLALVGFVLHGLAPLVFYSAGIGLFLLKEWARIISVRLVPFFVFGLFLNQAWNRAIISARMGLRQLNAVTIFLVYKDFFLQAILLAACVVWFVVWYLGREDIREYIRIAKRFSSQTKQEF